MHWNFSGTTIVPKHLNPEFLPGFFIVSFCPELTTVNYKLQSNFQNWTSIFLKRLIWPHIFSEQFDFKDAKRISVKLALGNHHSATCHDNTHSPQTTLQKGKQNQEKQKFSMAKVFCFCARTRYSRCCVTNTTLSGMSSIFQSQSLNSTEVTVFRQGQSHHLVMTVWSLLLWLRGNAVLSNADLSFHLSVQFTQNS